MSVSWHRRAAASIAVVALVAAACSGDDTASTDPTTSMTVATSNAVTESTAPLTTAPRTTPTTIPPDAAEPHDLDSQLNWMLEVLNGLDPTADEYESRFGADFKAQVSYDDFVAPLSQMRGGQSGWSVIDTEERDEQSGSFVIAPASGEPVALLVLGIVAEDAGRIETLFLQPAAPPTLDDPPATFDEAVVQLDALGRSAVLVADVTDGECVPIEQADAESAMPIGSAFKLYVLGAVAQAIAGGELAWDDELEFTLDLASLPTGITQDEAPGARITVLELAGRMIGISDNTATDMLIDAVGRDAVAAMQVPMGHGEPELNQPFMTTRELFIIKLDADLLARYGAADPTERETILAEIADRDLPTLGPDDFTTDPVAPDRVEWFASPADLCRALVYLADSAEQAGLEPVRDIMTASPGLPSERFDEIWYKGGSEPGLLAIATLVRDDDRSYVVAGSVVNPEVAFDINTALLTLIAIRDLVPE